MTQRARQRRDIAVTAVSDGVLSTHLDVVIGLERAEASGLPARRPASPWKLR